MSQGTKEDNNLHLTTRRYDFEHTSYTPHKLSDKPSQPC